MKHEYLDFYKKHFKSDFLASFGVFVIAIPLSIGIALASGAPPASGLIAAILGGIAVGVFSGAPLVVSGPAAGLAALIFELVSKYGIAGLAFTTFLAGVLQFTFGIFKWGKVFSYVPKAVLGGMLAAIGIIIAGSQLHVLVGKPVPSSFLSGVIEFPSLLIGSFGGSSFIAPVLICGLLAIGIQLGWKKVSFLKSIPAALPAVFLVTLFSLFFEMPRVEIAPVLDTAISSATKFGSMFSIDNIWLYIGPALVLAIIASAETLLTARAVDDIVDDSKPSNLNQELLAQGFGNAASGLLGGLPLTGVIVRSGANVSFGAKTRTSTILHGFWVLLFVGLFPFILEAIPLTALAAILIITGFKLLNAPQVIAQTKKDYSYGVLWVSTCIGIMATNLLVGLLIGLGVAVAFNFKNVIEFTVNNTQKKFLRKKLK